MIRAIAGVAVLWLTISAIEADTLDRPLWRCVLAIGCGHVR